MSSLTGDHGRVRRRGQIGPHTAVHVRWIRGGIRAHQGRQLQEEGEGQWDDREFKVDGWVIIIEARVERESITALVRKGYAQCETRNLLVNKFEVDIEIFELLGLLSTLWNSVVPR